MATKPTHHYDLHGHMLHEGDLVEADHMKGRVFWDANRTQWMIDFGSTRVASLNLYPSRKLILIGTAHD